MAKEDKLVMQVTIGAQEFPSFYRELRDMRSGRQRANKLACLAYFGWLLERNELKLDVSRPAAPGQGDGQLVRLEEARPIDDWLSDLGGGDELDENADGRWNTSGVTP
jgi:hypothetical protein